MLPRCFSYASGRGTRAASSATPDLGGGILHDAPAARQPTPKTNVDVDVVGDVLGNIDVNGNGDLNGNGDVSGTGDLNGTGDPNGNGDVSGNGHTNSTVNEPAT